MTVFCKSYGNVLIRVFLHAELISAKQTEPKSMGFEKYAKNGIKNIYYYFLFFVIFSKSLSKINDTNWIMFLRWKKKQI